MSANALSRLGGGVAFAFFALSLAPKEATIDPKKLHSKNHPTPWGGWKVKGLPVYAIIRGHVQMKDGEPVGNVIGRVEMWRGGFRLNISVSASFVWRCLSGSAMTPFPHPAHRTGQADLPHPALGQDFTPSPTARRAQAGSGVRARSARKGAGVDRSRPCAA